MQPPNESLDFAGLYARFDSPISSLDCGEHCAPYNERGVPFCCDTAHTIPSAYPDEWSHLQDHTGLWHLWEGRDAAETSELRAQAPEGQVLIACLGYIHCQRPFRSIACRAFPFFPYITRQGVFIGLSYYWEYEDRCWVISNLAAVSAHYRAEFFAAFDQLFERMPEDRENFRHFSTSMRRVFGRRHRAIPLLHRNGFAYKITPRNGKLRRVPVDRLPKYGPYAIADRLPFASEGVLEISTKLSDTD
jgi:hypothetical protein